MIIRNVVKNDVENIAKLYISNWKETYKDLLSKDFLESLNEEHATNKWFKYIEEGNSIFVVYDEEEFLGFVASKKDDDIEKIKTNINKSKYIEYVKVKRRIPNSIIIDVKEKPIGCVLKDKGDNYYYVSENLCYMDKVERENIKSNCIIVESDFSIKENQIKFENNKDKEKLTSLIKYIKKDGLENKISSISFNSENKVNMTTKEGIEIVINSNSDIKHDIAKLTQILVDLKSKNINYGKINMTFSKYTLYTYK